MFVREIVLDFQHAADQLIAGNGYTCDYDATGNLWHKKDPIGPVKKTYAYTPDDLLSTVAHNDISGSPQSSMTWDASGNRTSFTGSNGKSSTFVYDPTASVPAIIKEVYNDGTNTHTIYYIREPNGALIARIDGSTTQYYHFDQLGSTIFLTDSSGILTDKYTYDAWGKTTHETLTGSINQPYQFVGQYGYFTHWQDPNISGLIQLGVRFYEPRTGRFTQVDALQEGNSWYPYVADNPFSAIDPSGRARWMEANIKGIIYQHAWLEFDIQKCLAHTSFGFYPKGWNDDPWYTKPSKIPFILTTGIPGEIKYDEPYVKKNVRKIIVKQNKSRKFECRLCKAILKSLQNVPWYRFNVGGYVCGSWARDMWGIASGWE